MNKRKRWKKVKYRRKNNILWKNRDRGNEAKVFLSNPYLLAGKIEKEIIKPKNKWNVNITAPTGENIGIHNFDTKKQASKFAINWMKKHPRG